MEETKKETKQVEKTEEKKVTTETKKETPKTTTKKVETKGVNNKKSNNLIIIIAIAAAVVAVIATIIAMSTGNNSPKKAVEDELKQLKTGAYAQELLSGFVQEEDGFNTEAQKLLFEKLEWKILSEKEEGETATVEVEITNKDFKAIMGNYMQKALKAAMTGKTTENDMTNYLMEELRNEEIGTVTQTQSITLEKKDGKWEVVEDDNFVNSVLPGLYERLS